MRATRRLRPILACLAILAAGAAEAATLKVDYRITLAGLTLGNADLTGSFEGERYDLKMRAQLTGLAGLFTSSGRGGAAAAGTLGTSRLSPSAFSATGRSGSTERTVQMGVSSGTATTVAIEPPFEERPDRVPLADAHRRGVIDPLSGLVAVAAARGKGVEPATCNRTVPVFDGTQRFNMVLSYGETRQVRKPGYAGEVLVCNARYVPVAGHRPLRPAVKFMEENRDISVWLAPVEGTRVLVPMRISVRTMLGTSVVEAERWSVE